MTGPAAAPPGRQARRSSVPASARRAVALAIATAGVATTTVVAGAVAVAVVTTLRVRRSARAAAIPFAPGGAPPRPGERPTPHAEAIVVFGATADEHGPSAELRERLVHAAALWQGGVAPLIVVSGGVANGVDEVDAMTDWLLAHGIPAGAIVPGRPGHNTRASIGTVRDLGLRRIVAVSSPFHAFRIEDEARRRGLDVVSSSPPTTPSTRRPRIHRARIAAEVAGVLWYALPPSLAARVNTGPGTLRHQLPAILAGEMHPRELVVSRIGRLRR